MSDDEDFDFATKSPPTPDPMAGIGYWVSPGNSPKKCPKICGSVQNAIAAFQEDVSTWFKIYTSEYKMGWGKVLPVICH